MKYRGILFDKDGTLLDFNRTWLPIYLQAASEFADSDPTRDLLASFENVVVLRTLSKALGLAGVRCGCLLARPELVELVARVMPPYSFPTPSQDAVLEALRPTALERAAQHIETLKDERSRLAETLSEIPGIRRVWPSDANFLLVETDDAEETLARARAGGVLLRDFSKEPGLGGCLRITVGSPQQNDRLITSLAAQ